MAVRRVPIGFMGGLTGALFTEFAFTLAGAVTVSAVVALTLSPMMSDLEYGVVSPNVSAVALSAARPNFPELSSHINHFSQTLLLLDK